MNLPQFLAEIAKREDGGEPIHQQLAREYARYQSPEATLLERNGFVSHWVEMAGPMLAAIRQAELLLNQIGEAVGYTGAQPPLEAIKSLVKERNLLRASSIPDAITQRLEAIERALELR